MYRRYLNWSVRHPWKVVAMWAVILLAALPLALSLSQYFRTDGLGVPNSPSAQVDHVLQKSFGTAANPTATVVFYNRSGLSSASAQNVMDRSLRRIRHVSQVRKVPSAKALEISHDGKVAWGQIVLQKAPAGSLKDAAVVGHLRQAVVSGHGTHTGITGLVAVERAFTNRVNHDLKTAEIWTLPLTLVALIWIFRSVVAPIGPLAIGFGGITVGLAVINLIARVMALAPEVEDAAAMIGLGVGIDYALLMVHRFRVARNQGEPAAQAAVTAGLTAGRAIMFSGAIVVAAFSLVLLINQPLLRSMALGSLAAVASTVLAALMLLPGLLTLLDRWLDWPFAPRSTQTSPWWRKRAEMVMRHPWWFLLVSTSFLVMLAFPVSQIKFWNPGVDTLPATSQTRQTYDILLKHTFAGVQGPIMVLASGSHNWWTAAGWSKLRRLQSTIGHTRDVHNVWPRLPSLPSQAFLHQPPAAVRKILSPNHRIALLTVYPSTRPESQATQHLVTRLRAIKAPHGTTLKVGGGVAYTVDVIHLIKRWILPIALLVAGSTFVLLWRLFRSVVLPIKAVVLNFLSVSAASGLIVLIFQKGLTAPITGLQATGAIDWTTPVILFTVLFGLSTDYEVFLLSRVLDHHMAGSDDRSAISQGMAETGRIITGAALIMITVFLAFGGIGLEFMQELGFGLGLAILIDATIVRLFMVPSIMRLLGRANWWEPAWISKRERRSKNPQG